MSISYHWIWKKYDTIAYIYGKILFSSYNRQFHLLRGGNCFSSKENSFCGNTHSEIQDRTFRWRRFRGSPRRWDSSSSSRKIAVARHVRVFTEKHISRLLPQCSRVRRGNSRMTVCPRSAYRRLLHICGPQHRRSPGNELRRRTLEFETTIRYFPFFV